MFPRVSVFRRGCKKYKGPLLCVAGFAQKAQKRRNPKKAIKIWKSKVNLNNPKIEELKFEERIFDFENLTKNCLFKFQDIGDMKNLAEKKIVNIQGIQIVGENGLNLECFDRQKKEPSKSKRSGLLP